MGQGWSQEYSGADAYSNAGATTSAGLGPRIRADSEPPTSAHYGGTKLNTIIPEDEELTTIPSNLAQMASADWKKASAESGILKEKPSQLAALLESKVVTSSTFSDASSLDDKELLRMAKRRDRTQSLGGYSHFADFSLFPDKYGGGPIKRRHPSSGSNISEEDRSIPCTPPPTPNITTPLQSVKDAFFRTRALSHDPDRETPDRNVVKSPSFNIGDTNNENKTTDDDSLHPIRPRASSYGGDRKHLRQKGVHADRQPFADYTFFPDKDPSVATIGSGLNRSQKKLNEEKSLRKAVLESKLEKQANEAEFAPKKIQATLSTRSGKPPTVIITPDNIEYVNSAVMIASALTIEANKQSLYKDKPKILNEEKNFNNNNTTKPATSRFNFFDYSMIPDKDPRAFTPNNKQRKQHEEIFGKDKN